MDDRHQPREEFVSHLEWQLRTALSRRERFAEPVGRNGWARARLAALILASVVFGAGAVLATQEVQDQRTREALLARVRTELAMAATQLEAAQASVDEVQRRVQAGIQQDESLVQARAALREAESRVQSLRLDEEEIRATGREPSDELSAPPVGGHDFVTERLQLDGELARERLERSVDELDRIQERIRLGIVSADEAAPAELELERAQQDVRLVDVKLDARRAFLRGELGTAQVERRVEGERLRGELVVGQLAAESAARNVDRMERLAAVGAVQETEVRRARLELTQRELAVELLQQKLELLDSLSAGEAPGGGG